MTPDTWLTVWEENGDMYTVDAQDMPRIDAAVSAYLDSAGTRDSILHLTLIDGREYATRASAITSWATSSPETRRRAAELSKWQDEETAQFRQELGIWDDA